MIASALFAHGIRVFGHHPKDGAPQGIFCANGQCAQCLVVADGLPVKACMTPVTPGMHVVPLDALPTPPEVAAPPASRPVEVVGVPVLILGGGPAGMSAAIELATHGVRTLLVDDKQRLGGKLVLQTHRFFGSVEAVYAGTRGIEIAAKLAQELRAHPEVEVWRSSTALAVYSDGRVGVLRTPSPSAEADEDAGEARYVLVAPEVLLVATGAREKSLAFPGNTLPGVYGAGAFQTLVNRDRVRAAERLFIVGGGNVGLIAGYHALQAGIEVVGLVEALPQCGGYKVHRDKLARLGVPIYTSHTVVSANGAEQVTSVTIAEIDADFRPIAGTRRTFPCDTVLIAVGLDPVDEFYEQARAFGLSVFAAGDAEEIAEASAAMFSGKIRGREIARLLGATEAPVPPRWRRTAEILKSHPGAVVPERIPAQEAGVFPVFHCAQEIPCNPCTAVCPRHLIHIDADDIRALPRFLGSDEDACVGCERCVAICPGLAITLVDYRRDREMPTVSLPYEFLEDDLAVGQAVTVLDAEGRELGTVEVTEIRAPRSADHTRVVRVRAPQDIAKRIAGLRRTSPWMPEAVEPEIAPLADDEIICRCERVTVGEVRALIRQGYRDMNEIKAVTRAGMGACGGKTCASLILRLFREAGVPPDAVTRRTRRPLFIEAPLGTFAGPQGGVDMGEAPAAPDAIPEGGLPGVLPPSDATWDAIIIGAGSVGVPAAWAMARAGLDVLVLDRFASQGQGSNKAAIGGVRATHSDPAKIRLCLRSLEIFSTWEATHGQDIEWTTGGYSFVAYRPEEAEVLQGLLKIQHAQGLNIDWYDRDALLDRVPALNPQGLLGGTFSPEDGHCSPLLAGHAVYTAARRAGATFAFHAPVREILTEPGGDGARRVVGVRTDGGVYRAPVVVNAAGAWAGEVGRMVGLTHPVAPESHEAGITEAVTHILDPMLVDIRPAPGSKNYYFFQLGSGQVVFCITPDPPIPGFDRRETSAFLPLVAPRMVGLVPRLANVRVRRTWRGLYPMTPDGSPLVGWAREVSGYLMAVGMCGQGFMLGPGLGELLARMVTHALVPEDHEVLQDLSPYRSFEGEEALK
jgi:glycine/D-amino acid oxidase-like deaminating enzyme/Fe-S-cluster-containing hydrogenase component 2/bacterioferritin-associated ferredoxin